MRVKIATLALIVIVVNLFIVHAQAAGLNVAATHKINVNDGSVNTSGDVINAGTLQTSTGSINLGGNWSNTGTFNAGTSGTVEFTGSAASTITGANTFFNFTCTQAGKTLNFEAGKTQTIAGLWTLTGITGNLISLRSATAGTRWSVNPTGTKNITFVDVKDSNNLGTVVNPASSNDSGNNINWFTAGAVTTTTIATVTTTIAGATTTTTTTTSTTLPVVTPTAAFSADPISGFPPLEVQFTDLSTGNPTSWAWEFGDGNTSSDQNPTKTYNLAGNFTARLVVSNGFGSTSTEKTINVIAATGCNAAFLADKTTGIAPLEVQFTDISTGNPASWAWEFGDGDISSEQNPAHTYKADGIFSVKLTVSADCGAKTVTQTNLIIVSASTLAPQAEFNANPTSGFSPLAVQFNNISTGNPAGFAWKFGDGDISSVENPLHTYNRAGIFTPSLLVSNSAGADFETKTNLINVLSENPPQSEFNASPLTGFAPLKVQFKDSSTGNVANWSWDFGDGVTSGLQNPDHEYINPGFYNVKLIVSNENGTGLENKIRLITILEGEGPTAAFLAEPLTGNAPFTVHFSDTSSGEVANHAWEFGDGDTSTIKDPVHTYKNAGSFNVKLTVSGKNGTDDESKTGLVTVAVGKDPTAGFAKDQLSVNSGQLSVKFKDISSSPEGDIISREWNFGDGTKSNEKDPTHTYTGEEGDTFTVSLTVKNADGFDTVTKPSFVSIASSIIPGFVKGRITDVKTGENVEGVECCIAMKLTDFTGTKAGAKIACAETTKDGLYFIQVASGSYVFTATKNGFAEFSKNINVTNSNAVTVNVKLGAGSTTGKSFTFNCEQNMKRGFFFGLETLTMNVGDTENCTLKLTNHEPGKTVEIANSLMGWFGSAIKIEPTSGVTDENGELAITITAKRKGKDWAAWAVPNDKGQFLFNMKTYDTGLAWGMFVEVK